MATAELIVTHPNYPHEVTVTVDRDLLARTRFVPTARTAFVMTYNDIFFVMTVVIVLSIPLVLFLRPLPKGMSLSMH